MKPVPASKYRHLVTILAPTVNLDAYNQDIQGWTTVATVWCSIRMLTGNPVALAQADTITSLATHEIRMRWRPDVTVLNRLRFQSAINFQTLTSAEFASLTSADFAAMVSSGPAPRYFTINSENNVEERDRELILKVTEVKA